MEETTSTPVRKKKEHPVLFAIVFMIVGAGLLVVVVSFGYINIFMTGEQCLNLSILYYQQGVIDVANFTTMTGNFTYIFNNTIETKGVQDYCVEMIQSLNQGQE